MSGTIVWFRQDLRLRDNPALHAAAGSKGAVIPVYIWSPEEEGDWPPGAASRWWLHQSLQALDASLRKRGSRLIFAHGRALEVLRRLAAGTGATAVYWNHRYEPAARQCSETVQSGLKQLRIETKAFAGSLLVEPDALRNLSGKPYRVYSAYRRRLLRDIRPARPLNAPGQLLPPKTWPRSLALGALKLMPKIKKTGRARHFPSFAAFSFWRDRAATDMACIGRQRPWLAVLE
jgi:deoxyribodipyrimidine photo-lyase